MRKTKERIGRARRHGLAAVALGAALGAPAVLAQDPGAVTTKQYDDGSVYEGTFRNGLQHGTGTYRLPNGYEYSGDWTDGEIRGEGRARFPNGSVYELSLIHI